MALSRAELAWRGSSGRPGWVWSPRRARKGVRSITEVPRAPHSHQVCVPCRTPALAALSYTSSPGWEPGQVPFLSCSIEAWRAVSSLPPTHSRAGDRDLCANSLCGNMTEEGGQPTKNGSSKDVKALPPVATVRRGSETHGW